MIKKNLNTQRSAKQTENDRERQVNEQRKESDIEGKNTTGI